jgi:hypothetical protein
MIEFYRGWQKPEQAAKWATVIPKAAVTATQESNTWTVADLDALNGHAWKLRQAGQLKESAALRRRIVAAAPKILPPDDHKRMFDYLKGISEVLVQLARTEEALTYYLQALAELEQMPDGAAAPEMVLTKRVIAQLYQSLGKPELAAGYEALLPPPPPPATRPVTRPTSLSR